MISKGFLTEARKLIAGQTSELLHRLVEGAPLLGLEPSCLLTLVDEWPELVPGPQTRRIAASARLADAWLAERLASGNCDLALTPNGGKCVLHGHCHQKALTGVGGTVQLLGRIPQLQVVSLDTGCCGMAGSFGYEKQHFDLSVAVARQSLLPQLEVHPRATIAAPGTSCRHQILDLTHRRALHPLEIVAGQLA
jgi:Fe-S oxidoreductase